MTLRDVAYGSMITFLSVSAVLSVYFGIRADLRQQRRIKDLEKESAK